MKQTQFDKHTIAWFKIADYVSRGEKERALGVYRLLAHSFNDNAIARQLEADIYCSFGDTEQATSLYRQAMDFYVTSERFLEAAAVGEHLLTVHSNDAVLRQTMMELYISLSIFTKVKEHLEILVTFIAIQKQWYDIKNIIIVCSKISDMVKRIEMYNEIIYAAHKVGYPYDILVHGIGQIIEDIGKDNKKSLQEFLSFLQALSDELYTIVVHKVKI